MKVTCQCDMTADGRRAYTFTNRKGETVTATVHDSGHGASIAWAKVLAKWPRAYIG